MHHIVECLVFELCFKLALTAQVQLDEMDALVLQELPGAGAAHGCPGVHATAQGLFYDIRAYESAGSSN